MRPAPQLVLLAAGYLAFAVSSLEAQPGPGDEGAVFRNPFADPTPPKSASVVKTPTPSADEPRPASPATMSTFDQILANLSVDPRYALNKDIEPTPDLGPWMICVHSYVTKEAPQWAREMVAELRTTHKLPAYVFTYGLEERRKEFDRVKALLDKQRAFLGDKDLPIMYAPRSKSNDAPGTPTLSHELPVEYAARLLNVQQIPVQCAVLVGGYPDENAASSALAAIKKLPQPDANKVKLEVKYYAKEDPNQFGKLQSGEALAVYVNPFKRAFLCRNPAVKAAKPAEAKDPFDLESLRRFNADEPFSLLQCKKPFTLAIKEFRTYTVIQDKESTPSVLEKIGLNTRAGQGVDQAAHDAHNLAEVFRKMKVEAYVLHTKFSSIITVGGYDSVDDPNLRAMQNLLENRFRAPEWAPICMFPRPMPMAVPR